MPEHNTRNVIIHQPSYVDPSAFIGARSLVWYFASIGWSVRIGEDSVIGSNCYIGRGSIIGSKFRMNHGSFLPNKSIVGNGVFIGPGVVFTDDKYPVAGNVLYNAEPPIIEDNVSVGAGAIILPGIRLGAKCMIGAGAVVTEDVAPGMTVIGLPARVL